MTQPGIEHRSPGPLANPLTIMGNIFEEKLNLFSEFFFHRCKLCIVREVFIAKII